MEVAPVSWVLAIDFGTWNTTAAYMAEGTAPLTLTVDGLPSVPSVVVADPDGHLVVGKTARNQAYLYPQRAERAPKRALAAGGDVVLGDSAFKPAELAGAVLRKMYDEAIRWHGGAVPATVILTHPARWGRPLKDLLREAGELAGISGPVLISEPEAAAWCYAPPVDGQVVAVFDLSGSTLDTAVLKATATGYAIVGQPGGDGELGGEHFDDRLQAWVLQRACERDEAAWAELTSARTTRAARDRARLREQVTLAREALSGTQAHDIVIDSFDEGFRVTREGFEELIADLAGRAAHAMRAAITAAEVDTRALAGLYLTGGASSTPLIARRLWSELGVRPQSRDDPKAAVALGALRAYAASWAQPAAAPARFVSTLTARPKLKELPPARRRNWDGVTSFNAGNERAIAAWSPDDRHLAVSLGQGVEIWAMPGSVKRKSLTWRIWSAISALAWSPDGDHIVTGQADSSALKIWSVSGEMRQLAVPDAGHVRSVAWHPHGDRIAVVDDQGTVRVVDQGTGALRALLPGGASGLADAPVAWHSAPAAGNALLIVAGDGGAVVRWASDLDSAGGLYPQADELFELDSMPGAFAWSNDGSRLAACGGGSVRFWDRAEPPARERPARKKVGGGEITAARWTPGDRYLLTALADSTRRADKIVGLTLWDAASREQVRSWTEASGEFEPCRGIALSNGGTQVACLRRGQAPAIHELSGI
jgi:WD40 repeat protein